MKIASGIIVTVACLSLFLLPCPASADPSEVTAAVSAAESFLQLVDSGRYAESWDAAASFFKQRVPKQQWIEQIGTIRPTLGPLVRREVKYHKFTRSLPGAPDGEYVVIQFSSSFENKKIAVETVTPMLDADGQWRVSGYYIR